jgi:hypothetical protein
MAAWGSTAYVYWSRRSELVAALEDLFLAEGYIRIDRPAERVPEPGDRMRHGPALENRIWAAAVLPGRDGWSVLKTAPLELLCEASSLDGQPRLAGLASILRCPAFQYNLYEGAGETLLEADPAGEVRRSGIWRRAGGSGPDPMSEAPEAAAKPSFELLQVPVLQRLFGENPQAQARAAALARTLCELPSAPHDPSAPVATHPGPSAAWSNEIQLGNLIPHRELTIPGSTELYFASAVRGMGHGSEPIESEGQSGPQES